MNRHYAIANSIGVMLATLIVTSSVMENNKSLVSAQLPFIPNSGEKVDNIAPSNRTTSTSITNRSGTALNLTNAYGDIASLQNNATGSPTWLVTGKWNMSIPTATSQSNNQTSLTNFKASFTMIKLDGTEKHKHTISDFRLLGSPQSNNIKSATITGTVTVSLKDGPHNNVPITIKVQNGGAISIMPKPTSVNGHFGNTPIYGIVWGTH
jgi:hypothetical protein